MSLRSYKRYVHPNEILTRFCRDDRVFEHHTVFKCDKNQETSMFRTTKCNDASIWLLSDRFVSIDKPCFGRVEVDAATFATQNLKFLPDGDPHPRHVTIGGWSSDKGIHLMQRMDIVKNAKWTKR